MLSYSISTGKGPDKANANHKWSEHKPRTSVGHFNVAIKLGTNIFTKIRSKQEEIESIHHMQNTLQEKVEEKKINLDCHIASNTSSSLNASLGSIDKTAALTW